MQYGLSDFYRWISQCHNEWVLLAARAPLDPVARGLIEARAETSPEDFVASGRWLRDVPVRAAREGDHVTPLVALVQLKGHPWTVAIYELFNLSDEPYGSALKDALSLSEQLDTLALVFSAEDKSFACGYHLYDRGELMEVAQWSPDTALFGSARRPPPSCADRVADCLDDLSREVGLYFPPCYGRVDRDNDCLAVDGVLALDRIERADLIDLRRHFRRYRSMTLDDLRDSFGDRLVTLRKPFFDSVEPDAEDDPF
jgi:hypothetical protein